MAASEPSEFGSLDRKSRPPAGEGAHACIVSVEGSRIVAREETLLPEGRCLSRKTDT